jgi:sialate O-acetylesterase
LNQNFWVSGKKLPKFAKWNLDGFLLLLNYHEIKTYKRKDRMNKYWFYKVGLVVVFLCFALLGGAKVKLPTLVSDGMVLQRGEPVNIWGTADPDETVDITFLKKKYKTVADVQGNWKVTLPILKAGGP